MGDLTVSLSTDTYSVPANSNALIGTTGLQAAVPAQDLCSGKPMYTTSATGAQSEFSGAVISTDTTHKVQVQYSYSLASGSATIAGSQGTAVPVSLTLPGATVDLATTWTGSSWDPASWAGLKSKPPPRLLPSLVWPGTAPHGTAGHRRLRMDWIEMERLQVERAAWAGAAWDGCNGAAPSGAARSGAARRGGRELRLTRQHPNRVVPGQRRQAVADPGVNRATPEGGLVVPQASPPDCR